MFPPHPPPPPPTFLSPSYTSFVSWKKSQRCGNTSQPLIGSAEASEDVRREPEQKPVRNQTADQPGPEASRVCECGARGSWEPGTTPPAEAPGTTHPRDLLCRGLRSHFLLTSSQKCWFLTALSPGVFKALSYIFYFVVQFLSHVQHFATPWTAARQASLSFTISLRLLKLMSIESVMPSNHLILCHPLVLLPSIFPSIRVFSSESVLGIRWPKEGSFSFSASPSNEYSMLIFTLSIFNESNFPWFLLLFCVFQNVISKKISVSLWRFMIMS